MKDPGKSPWLDARKEVRDSESVRAAAREAQRSKITGRVTWTDKRDARAKITLKIP